MASSDSSTDPPPPGTMNHLPSTKPTFCDSSCNRDGISRGRCVASSDRSATRDERLAERTDANVAPASTNVPPAVARAEIVTQSATPQVYGPQSPGAGAPARRRTMSRDSRRSRKDANMINDANTGFMLLAASLVMLMTPGLAFFYGGLVGRSKTLTIMIQSFLPGDHHRHVVAGRVLAVLQRWSERHLWQLRRCLPAQRHPFVDVYAVPHPSGGVDRLPDDVRDHHAGTDHRRVHKPRHVQSVPGVPRRVAAVRLLPVRAHDLGERPARPVRRPRLRPRRRGSRLGGLGGAGIGAVRWQAQIRRCAAQDPFIALLTGLLWFGWYGFNAGSELNVDDITATAFLNTDLAASFAATPWLFVEWRHARKPHFVGLLTGAVAGLATITSAAGFVPIYASVIIGIVSGFVCYYAVQLKNRLRWDDALDVWGVHGVGGMLGIVLLGVFASTAINPAGGVGLIHGSASFFGKQVVAAFACSLYAFAFTYVMLKVIDRITPVRVGEEAEQGLDEAMHGESAYEDAPLVTGSAAPAL